MTTYGTYDIDSVPAPSDFELEAYDKRRIPDWLHEAIIQAEDARDEKATQADALGILF